MQKAYGQGYGPQNWSKEELKELVYNIKELIGRHTYGAINLVGRNGDTPDVYLPQLGDYVLSQTIPSTGNPCPEPCACGGMTTAMRQPTRDRMNGPQYGGGSYQDYDFSLIFVTGCPIGGQPGNSAYCGGAGGGTYVSQSHNRRGRNL